MKFKVSASYKLTGEDVLKKYRGLENYDAVIENGELYITLNSLEELIRLKNYVQDSIIIDEGEENYIVIYDDWIE